MAEEVVHGYVQSRLAHRQQHQRRVAHQSQEVAEEDEDEEDRLQGGPVGEAQQEEALLCAVVALKGNSQVWKDDTHRAMCPLQAMENPDHGSGEGEQMAAHTCLGVHWSSFTDLNL